MANININVNEFLCEEPVVYDLKYLFEAENVYLVSWTSQGNYYQSTVDPGTIVELWYSVNGEPFELHPANPTPFDAVDFELNFNDLPVTLPIMDLTVRVKIVTNYCEATGVAYITSTV